MQLHLTVPLYVRTISGRILELLPVVMTSLPNTGRESNLMQWMDFYDIPSETHALSEKEVAKVERYMRSNGTVVLSEDGITAVALDEGRLLPCNFDLVEFDLSPSDLY